MNTIPPHEHCLALELDALFANARDHRDTEARQKLFVALLALERRAGLAEVSEAFLRRISETRFLAGILRDAVAPVSYAGPYAARRALRLTWSEPTGAQDLDTISAA